MLTKNRVELLHHVVADVALVTELATVGCITWPQREHVSDIKELRDRNSVLLEVITRRSVADFKKFIDILAKEQAHLKALLHTDGGKTYFVSAYIRPTINVCQH